MPLSLHYHKCEGKSHPGKLNPGKLGIISKLCSKHGASSRVFSQRTSTSIFCVSQAMCSVRASYYFLPQFLSPCNCYSDLWLPLSYVNNTDKQKHRGRTNWISPKSQGYIVYELLWRWWNLACLLLIQSAPLLFSLETAYNHFHHLPQHRHTYTQPICVVHFCRELVCTAPFCNSLPSLEDGRLVNQDWSGSVPYILPPGSPLVLPHQQTLFLLTVGFTLWISLW